MSVSVELDLPVHCIVKPGDSLWKIAQETLGNGSLFPKLIEANPGRPVDANSVIHPGDILIIPAA